MEIVIKTRNEWYAQGTPRRRPRGWIQFHMLKRSLVIVLLSTKELICSLIKKMDTWETLGDLGKSPKRTMGNLEIPFSLVWKRKSLVIPKP